MKRYAIRMGPNMYSAGTSMSGTSFERAKLWKTLGHIKLHLQSRTTRVLGQQCYPAGSEAVEVTISYTEAAVCSIDKLQQQIVAQANLRSAESEVISAERCLKYAESEATKAEAAKERVRAAREALSALQNKPQ